MNDKNDPRIRNARLAKTDFGQWLQEAIDEYEKEVEKYEKKGIERNCQEAYDILQGLEMAQKKYRELG